jgi:hypothetical protein
MKFVLELLLLGHYCACVPFVLQLNGCVCVCVSIQVPAHTDRRNDQTCPQQDSTSSGRSRLRPVIGCDSNLYYCKLVTIFFKL